MSVHYKAAKVLLYTCAGLFGVLLLVLLALKLALDRAPLYQAQIKQWVYAQTGYHIAFAGVSPSFRWYGPELHFDRLELRSKDDQRVLARAAGGRIAADIWQLISSGKLLAGRLELDSPTLVITRLGSTIFALASDIKLGGGDHSSSLESLTLDDLPVGKVAIRDATVTMRDWNPALPQLELKDVDLDLRRDVEDLALALSARLPAALGGTLNVILKAHGLGRLETLSWNAALRARAISFQGWRRLMPDYLSRLDEGTGTFDLEASGSGAVLASADLTFDAQGVVTQLSDGPSAKFQQISGVLNIVHAQDSAHVEDRWTLTGNGVRAVRYGRRDPDSQFEVSWRSGEAGLLDVRARASYLRADTLLPLGGLVPDKVVRDRLQEIAPTGEWTDATIAFTRSTDAAPWRLAVQAKFRDVGFAPVNHAPGLRGLTGSIAGTESGGHLAIDAGKAVFTWPYQLQRPVELDNLKTTLFWKRTNEEILVATSDFEMQNRDAGVRAKASWLQPADGPSPVLTLVTTVEDGNVAETRHYLPRALLAPPALAWMDQAFLAGHLSRADLVLQGPLRSFPFRDGSGVFLVRCALEDMTLNYFEGWPQLKDLKGEVVFRNEGMTAHMVSGRVGGVPIASAEARIADFSTAELEVHLGAKGDAADALGFLRASPLDAMADHAFSGVDAKGPMQTKVDLDLPFKDFEHRRTLVHGRLDGVTVNRTGSTVAATDVNGDFDVDGAQVARADVGGRLFGGNFQMQARAPRSRPLTRTQLDFQGTLSGEALRTELALPPELALSGQTEWRATYKIAPEPNRERSLRVSGNLVGLESVLPAPLDKAADTPLPTSLDIQWPASGGVQGRFALGSLAAGSFGLQPDAGGMHLAALTLMFGSGDAPANDARIANDAQLVTIGGSVARLDLSGWIKALPAGKSSRPLSDTLRTARLHVEALDYLGLTFQDVTLNLAASDSALRVTAGGPNVEGTVTVPVGAAAAAAWDLQFERLHFDAADEPASQPAGGATALADPRGIPDINFHAADVQWGERQFGDVHATLVKLDDGIALTHLTVVAPSFNGSAQGEWRGQGVGLGRMEGTLTSSDAQDTLKALGYAPLVEARSGHVDFDLTWVGAPSADSLSVAVGRVQGSLEHGQIVGINPGAGRVLGLTSVAELRRRLALDFSDLTDKGFAFDTARGTFDLRDGSAFTDDLVVKGPAAEIGLIGRVGLKNRDYDQTAVVTGNVGNSLPIAALAGGPVVAGAVLLFTQVFKQPLKGLARGYYRITGTWDNPVVERIKSAEAAAATAEAPK